MIKTTKFYLVTGFLGAGKTTFLKNFLHLLAGAGLQNPARLHIIINEFGKQGVDGTLLNEVGAVLDEINNGSIFCSCRLDKFESVLQDALKHAPDIIVAEASGLADPTSVRSVLRAFSASGLEYMGSICLADAVRLEKVYDTAQVCKRQLSVSSLVLLNKTDAATKEQIEHSTELIKAASPAAHIEKTVFGKFKNEWLSFVVPNADIESAVHEKDITLQKQTLEISKEIDIAALKSILAMLCDSTYRMKGFVSIKGGVFHVDCTGPDIQIKPWEKEADNKIVLLAGRGMPLRQSLKKVREWYGTLVITS